MEDVDLSKPRKKHECAMPPPEDIVVQYIDDGYFVATRRFIRRMVIVSDTNPQSKNCFKSTAAIRLEKARHLQHHYYMIHPFSDGRAYWEFYICAVLFAILIVIPIEITNMEIIWAIKIPKFFLDLNCLIDVCVNFVTGFYDRFTRKIVLGPKQVAKNYIFGFFVVDLVSSTPADMVMTLFGDADANAKNLWYISLFTYLKILRILTILKYLDRLRDWNEYNIYRFKLFKLLVVFMFGLLWGASITFLITRNINPAWAASITLFKALILCCYEIILKVCLVGYGAQSSKNPTAMMFGMLYLTVGIILQIFVLAQILQIVKKYNSSRNKYQMLVQQLEEYSRYKFLPDSMRRRIHTYFDYRFQKQYYKVSDIFGIISGQLRQDIIIHSCKRLVESVPLFKELPTSLLVRIVGYMKSEIYLPNDVICRAGQTGDSMFFISSGTVAVYTVNGKELCHLADGSYFGEIALVLKNQNRVASVVAIESCELYNLSQTDYQKAIEPYPDLLYRIQKLAIERLQNTMTVMQNLEYRP